MLAKATWIYGRACLWYTQLKIDNVNMPIDEEVQREMDHHADDDKSFHTSMNTRMKDVEDRMGEVEQQLGSKISWPWFIGTMISIMGIQIGLWAYLIQQINVIQADQQETRISLSTLNGKLEPFDFSSE